MAVIEVESGQFDKLLDKLDEVIYAVSNSGNSGSGGSTGSGTSSPLGGGTSIPSTPPPRRRNNLEWDKRWDAHQDMNPVDKYYGTRNPFKWRRIGKEKTKEAVSRYKDTQNEYDAAREDLERYEQRHKKKNGEWRRSYDPDKHQKKVDKLNAAQAKNKDALIDMRQNQSMKGAAGNAAASVIKVVTDTVIKVADAIANIAINNMKMDLNDYKTQVESQMTVLKANSQMLQNTLKLTSAAVSKTMSSSFSSITDGVREGSYSAMQTMMELGTENLKTKLENSYIQLQKVNKLEILERNRELENLKLHNDNIKQIVEGGAAVVGAVAMIPAVGAVAGAVIMAGAALAAGAVSIWNKFTVAESEIAFEKLKIEKEYIEEQKKAYNELVGKVVDGAKEIVKPITELANSIWQLTEKAEDSFIKAGRNLGIGAESMSDYVNKMFKEQRNLYVTDKDGKRHFMDKNGEDMAKLQSQYIENTGFSVQLQHDDFMKTFSLGKLWGDETATTLVSSMQLFNRSAADSSDIFFEMYDHARKMGISQAKYSKDLVKNLKLAEKYQFKNGTKGLMQMAAWAQKTRFNMDSLSGILDDIHNGGLEGLITKAAGMQVLGGGFAMGADPLAMGYEAYMDPEGYAKRMQGMMNGIGVFNSKTGEVDFNMVDQMRLEQFAKLSGQSKEDLMNQQRQRIKEKEVSGYITNGKYTDEQKNLIYSKATLDANGKWNVNGKDINNLSDKDFAELMPHEEQIEFYVGKIYSMMEESKGATNYGQSLTMDNTKDEWRENYQKQIDENIRFFESSAETVKGLVVTAYDYMTKSNEDAHKFMEDSAKIATDSFRLIRDLSEGAKRDLLDESSVFRTGLEAWMKAANAAAESADAYKAGIEALKKWAGDNNVDVSGDPLAVKNFKKTLEEAGGISNLSNILKSFKKGNDENPLWYNDDMIKTMNTLKTLPELRENLSEQELRIIYEYDADGDNDNYKYANKNEKEYIEKNNWHNGEGTQSGISNVKSAVGDRVVNDASMQANGEPMAVTASKVTPINDGEVAITSPDDHAIFAKVGGPFDTLFNGIFKKINKIYDVIAADKAPISGGGTTINFYNNDVNGWYSFANSAPTTNNANQNTTSYANSRLQWNVRNGYTANNPLTSNTYSSVNGYSSSLVNRYGGNRSSMSELAKRLNFNSLGVFNANTNDVDFNMADELRFNEFANLTGQSVDEIRNMRRAQIMSGINTGTMIMPKSYDPFDGLTVSDFNPATFNNVSNGVNNGNDTIKIEPVKVEMSGSLELTSGGQSVNILEELQKNPALLRALSDMIGNSINSKMNGGRQYYSGGRII